MAASSDLYYHNNYMQAKPAKDSEEKEDKDAADDVWKQAAGETDSYSEEDFDVNESEANDFIVVEGEVTSFVSKNDQYRKMVEGREDLPYGAENWVYSSWNYKGEKPTKLSPYWWFLLILKFVKITHNGYAFFAKIDSKFYWYDVGRKGIQLILKIVFLLDKATSWNLFEGAMKPWAARAVSEPKPDNYKELKYRPTTWSAMKKVKKEKKLPF